MPTPFEASTNTILTSRRPTLRLRHSRACGSARDWPVVPGQYGHRMAFAPWSSIPALLDDAAGRFPHGEALVDGSERWTFPELVSRVHDAASALIASGVAPGDRIG